VKERTNSHKIDKNSKKRQNTGSISKIEDRKNKNTKKRGDHYGTQKLACWGGEGRKSRVGEKTTIV